MPTRKQARSQNGNAEGVETKFRTERAQRTAADLHQTRLLIALDALFRNGNVSAAAASLGIHVSALSRMLGELRELYQDQLFVRTGKGMRPTPAAETLRLKVRMAVTAIEELLTADSLTEGEAAAQDSDGWQQATAIAPVPLAVTNAERLDGSPTPSALAHRIAAISGADLPWRRMSKYIALSASGPGRSRPLTQPEARDAFTILLRGEADPIQAGALLLTAQYRGVTAPEIAGFIEAVEDLLPEPPAGSKAPDLDWPAYVSASWRHAPWFIHAARLVASAGHTVVMHGNFGFAADSGKLELAMADHMIPVCLSLAEARESLKTQGIVYLPLGAIAPQLQSLLGLYQLLGTRTPVHFVPHLVNPLRAKSTVMGMAQLARHDMYRDVAILLGRQQVTMAGSMRDFLQINPNKAVSLSRIVQGRSITELVAGQERQLQPEGLGLLTQREYWRGLWSGAVADELASETVIRTAAVALLTLEANAGRDHGSLLNEARRLWESRDRRLAPLGGKSA